VTSHPQLKLLSVIIPARDEERCIASIVENVIRKVLEQPQVTELIVVNNASTSPLT